MATSARPRHLWRVALVVVVLLVAINLMILAARQHPSDTVANLPTNVVSVMPEPQQVMRPQDTIGAQLRSGFQAQLYINGGAIPADQVSGDPNLGQYEFRPGCAGTRVPQSDCVLRVFPPGTINLRVEFWPQSETLETAEHKKEVQNFDWQATVG
jgi:hypothetical protein